MINLKKRGASSANNQNKWTGKNQIFNGVIAFVDFIREAKQVVVEKSNFLQTLTQQSLATESPSRNWATW